MGRVDARTVVGATFLAFAACGEAGSSPAETHLPRSDLPSEAQIPVPPTDAEIFFRAGNDCLGAEDYACAAENYGKAAEEVPESGPVLANLAWVLSTAPDEAVRDGERAVESAETAVELARSRDALEENLGFLVSLATAYAEVGRFDEAVETMDLVLDIGAAQSTDDGVMERYRAIRAVLSEDTPWRAGPA